jgi:imidazolonepropionase-like amidohydrolase
MDRRSAPRDGRPSGGERNITVLKEGIMPRRFIPALIGVALLAWLQPAPAQSDRMVAFTNVTVVPMDSDRVLSDQTVLVTGDRITAVGPGGTTQAPAGATRVDGKGKFLMPGLAEMHGHIPGPKTPRQQIDDILFLYVANGVTTVRGMQGAPGQLELREGAKRGEIVAPNLYLAGPAFSGNSVKTAEEAVAMVRQQHAEGWDLLKVLPGLTRDVYDAMAKTAREVGIPFAGHVPSDVGILHALEMGQHTVDHLDGYAQHLDGLTKPIDEKALADLVARTRRAGTIHVPTLVVWETLQGPVTLESRTQWPELKYLPAEQIDAWTKALQTRVSSPQFDREGARIHIENRMKILKALHAGGVTVLLGSDAPQQFNVPGFSIYREMKRMADAGMSTYEIVRSGTASVGEHFKSKDAFGRIAPGQRADLILVDGNPLQDLGNMEKRSGVMIRGRWIPQAEIEKRLAQIASAR